MKHLLIRVVMIALWTSAGFALSIPESAGIDGVTIFEIQMPRNNSNTTQLKRDNGHRVTAIVVPSDRAKLRNTHTKAGSRVTLVSVSKRIAR